MYLTEKEVFDFENVLKKKQRPTLSKLWKEEGLNRKSESDLVYRRVFGGVYSAAGDVRLRNERRLLREVFRDFLAARYLQRSGIINEHTRDVLYLEEVMDRREWNLFFREIRSIRRKMEERNDTGSLIQLLQMELNVLINEGKTDRERIVSISEINTRLRELESLHDQRRSAIARNVEAWCNHWLGAVDTEIRRSDKAPEKKDEMVVYYDLKTRSLQGSADDRMALLTEMKEMAESIKDLRFPRERELAVILSNLGLEYSFRQDFETSVACFRESLIYRKSIPLVNAHQIIYNLIGVLLRSGNIRDAISLIRSEEADMKKDVFLAARFQLLQTMALLLAGKTKDALQLHRTIKGELSFQDDLYHRIQEVILLVERKKTEIAERLVRNLNDQLRGKTEFNHYVVFLKILGEALRMDESDHRKKRTAWNDRSHPSTYLRGNVLPLLWLRQWLGIENSSIF